MPPSPPLPPLTLDQANLGGSIGSRTPHLPLNMTFPKHPDNEVNKQHIKVAVSLGPSLSEEYLPTESALAEQRREREERERGGGSARIVSRKISSVC